MTDDAPKKHDLNALLAVMVRLRDPDTGCPWDVKQTFASIAPYTIEEAYEVADAIARGDVDGLKDELGDLLLQVVYHARMAEEQSQFDFGDVADAITRKMIRRHPHVFEDTSRREEFMASDLWDRIKAEEKAERGHDLSVSRLLDDVPVGLPGLTRAVKLQKRAAKVGFDWPDLGPVLAKAEEEIAELKAAIAERDTQPNETWANESSANENSREHVAEEFGDLLFVMANLARHLGVDPEAALRGANAKFMRRFGSIEAALSEQGRTPEDATLEEMDRLWDAAKEVEREDAEKEDAKKKG